ncbi:MAG: GNAT family N-acetyltransferase [Betaproteobacteria bacterium]|jgi:ribosomal-protein-alanine N-acetyltransferase
MIVATEDPLIHLRPWNTGDYESLVRYGDNKLVWRNLTDMFPHPYTRSNAVEWVALASEPSESIFLAIDLAGEAIGGVGVIAREGNDFHTGQFGYWLGQPHWGRGLATKVARALKSHAFSRNRFKRLEAPVFAWNPPSMRVLEKVGFIREGVLRKSVLKDGQLIDSVMYAAVSDA